MSRVHAKAGDVSWGKDGKAEEYIAIVAYIRESRRKRLSLVGSSLVANLRRNRCEGLPALSCPWVVWQSYFLKMGNHTAWLYLLPPGNGAIARNRR